ncbi:DNA repair protein RecN [Lentilactobacillus hilgardii]|uniref:DNA repair protein RecN n=2 Tax=Lentilactobacillus hilgardii TaxID=1588 RepID=A0A6P1E6G5_LENHI|nr:DNA repair protein RecN [Lentilactobacillus hilgardii]EEI70192.1 DNA repair protein RecN [Lentilactobacillus hilgardii ATCC 27305]MCT3391706.1 DNA repair protein RecN [Lentilactobacillus hilgardii]QHB52179.1 DNA repair protein RecN [Lentilactobacillus hilgardii]RRG11985.1 MAG: DNA repair protein RecN [Lactobacillus sp.]
MLLELSITDFAIIEHLDIEFQSGMTVLTGETGAGKSIIIDAVGLLVGGRGSHDLIRTGAKKSVIQGNFILSDDNPTYEVLDELGIDHSDGNVIIEREIFASGRNSCRVNGMMINIATLRRIGETMVDIQGQNEHQELMKPERHIELLDDFAEDTIQPVLVTYQKDYDQFVKLRAINEKKHQNEKEWAQRVDMLKFQIKEIEAADLHEHEDEELTAERDRLNNFQKIHDALLNSYEGISGEDTSSLDSIGSSMSSMQEIEELDPDFKQISDDLSGAFYTLQDVASQISDQLNNLEFDQDRLDQVEQRLNTIYQLKHKYGDSVTQILEYLKKIKNELSDMSGDADDDDNLEQQLAEIKTSLIKNAKRIGDIRRRFAKELERAVHQQLRDLYMDKAVFEVRFKESTTLNRLGADQVEFYIQTNPGEKMLPLVKSASGGELSRLMLALKTMFAKAAGVTSIIFDEVDTGVSGRVAQAMGNKIYTISTKSQVLCITHLPQVAAMSDHHYFIQKKIHDGRTTTTITELNKQDSVNEISRMLSGTTVTKLTKEHASELISMADEEKARIRT